MTNLSKSVENGLGRGSHEVVALLLKCIDFTTLFACLVGQIKPNRSVLRYNRKKMSSQGKEEFLDLIGYFCQLRHLKESDLNIDEDVAVDIHNDIKNYFASVV